MRASFDRLRRGFVRLGTFGVAMIVVGACGGDGVTAPASVVGAYALVAYDGHALPTVYGPAIVTAVDRSLGTAFVRCETQLLADTLHLADDRFTHRRVSRLQCDDGRAPATTVDDEAGTYAAHGDSVSLAISIPLDVPASMPPASRSTVEYATRDGGSLVVGLTVTRTTGFFESTLFDPTELRYARVP